MLERVGEALLDDSIRGEIKRAREREGLALDLQIDGKAGAGDLSDQRVEVVETGLWGEVQKLSLRDRVQAVVLAYQTGLFEGETGAPG